MMTNALRICHARFGNLLLFNGEGFILAELHNAPAAYGELFKKWPAASRTAYRPWPTNSDKAGRSHRRRSGGERCSSDPLRVATIQILQARSFLAVPMLKERELVGAIVIYRQEVWRSAPRR